MTEQIEQTITSLEVAEMVGKNHKEVLRDIRKIIDQSGQRKLALTYFQEDSYEDVQGKNQPMYQVSKKGCEIFGNRMAGAKGTQFTFGYVERFNQMEQHIKQQKAQLPSSPREMMKLIMEASEETNVRLDDVDARLTDIEENKLITTEDKGTIDAHVRKKVAIICKDWSLGNEAKHLLYQDISSSIKRLFKVPNRGRIKDKDFIDALDFVDTWEPSSVTKAQIGQLNLFG